MNESNFQPSPGTSAGGAVDGLPTDDSGGFRPYVVGNKKFPLPTTHYLRRDASSL
jgi:hypothetical protein